jgi:hypothetical protein
MVRLGKLAMAELAMVAKVNLTSFEQTEVVRLKSDGIEWVVIRLRSDGFEWAAARLCGDFEHVAAGLHSNRWAQGWLMQKTWWWQAYIKSLWAD